MQEKIENIKIKLFNVRLSHPHVFHMTQYQQNEPQYQAAFILDKVEHADKIKEINTAIDSICTAVKRKRETLKISFKDGDTTYNAKTGELRPEYKNSFFITAAAKKNKPIVRKRDAKTPITEEDNLIYGGCIVDAVIHLFYYGKVGNGISASLNFIRYVDKGVPFGHVYDPEGEFEPLPETIDEDDFI